MTNHLKDELELFVRDEITLVASHASPPPYSTSVCRASVFGRCGAFKHLASSIRLVHLLLCFLFLIIVVVASQLLDTLERFLDRRQSSVLDERRERDPIHLRPHALIRVHNDGDEDVEEENCRYQRPQDEKSGTKYPVGPLQCPNVEIAQHLLKEAASQNNQHLKKWAKRGRNMQIPLGIPRAFKSQKC